MAESTVSVYRWRAVPLGLLLYSVFPVMGKLILSLQVNDTVSKNSRGVANTAKVKMLVQVNCS